MFLGPMVLDGDTPLDLYVFLCNLIEPEHFCIGLVFKDTHEHCVYACLIHSHPSPKYDIATNFRLCLVDPRSHLG